MKRRNVLLNKRNQFERTFESLLLLACEILSAKYRIYFIPQKTKFIKGHGLVYGDFVLRVVHNSTNYGRKVWIEIDEPYHESVHQRIRDEKRQSVIMKAFNQPLFIRYKASQLNDPSFINWLVKDLDWANHEAKP